MTATDSKYTNQRTAADVKQAILDAARDLLAAGGTSGLSMRHIADRVGVTATAIYHYFAGKQDIVNQVVLSAFERFGAYLKDAMDVHPRGSLDRLHALGEAYIRFAFENDAHFRVLFSIQHKSHDVLEEIPEGGGYNLLREAVVEAIEAGTIKDADEAYPEAANACEFDLDHADLISMYLWSLTHGLVTLTLSGAGKRCDSEGEIDAAELLRAIAPLVNHGLSKPATRAGTNDA